MGNPNASFTERRAALAKHEYETMPAGLASWFLNVAYCPPSLTYVAANQGVERGHVPTALVREYAARSVGDVGATPKLSYRYNRAANRAA